MRFAISMPVELAGLTPARPCGRHGYRCSRLFCQERCTRTDIHLTGQHRCSQHAPAPDETWPLNGRSVS